jgi:hypothetical protein
MHINVLDFMVASFWICRGWPRSYHQVFAYQAKFIGGFCYSYADFAGGGVKPIMLILILEGRPEL